MVSSRFVIRRNQGHVDSRNDELVPFLPMSTAAVCRCKVYEGEQQRNGRISLLRDLVQRLGDDDVLQSEGTRGDVLEMVLRLVQRDNLYRYFEAMMGMSIYEFEDFILRQVSTE